MNRLENIFASMEEEPYGDFWVVSGDFGSVCVSAETAREIERRLDRFWTPTWLVFRDRVGSRVRVRARQIRAVAESTAEQRAGDRRIDRARRREEQADTDRHPWDGD